MDHEKLITAWIERYELIEREGNDSEQAESLFWAFEQLDALCRRDPEKAWPLVVQILGRTESEFVLENLAAGPLETLLAHHGPLLIDRVEAWAHANPSFKWLLGGVWKNLISDDVWERIQKAVSRSEDPRPE